MTFSEFQPFFDLLCAAVSVLAFGLGYIGGYLQ
jgi:hypothetical protein